MGKQESGKARTVVGRAVGKPPGTKAHGFKRRAQAMRRSGSSQVIKSTTARIAREREGVPVGVAEGLRRKLGLKRTSFGSS